MQDLLGVFVWEKLANVWLTEGSKNGISYCVQNHIPCTKITKYGLMLTLSIMPVALAIGYAKVHTVGVCNRSLGVRHSHPPNDQSFPFFQSMQVPTCSSKVSCSDFPLQRRSCSVSMAAEAVGSQQAECYRARLCMALVLLQWLHTVCGAACWHKRQASAEGLRGLRQTWRSAGSLVR